jgi:hypothetical protein
MVIATGLVCASTMASGASLVEFWRGQPDGTLTSPKSIPKLEQCIGANVSEYAAPSVLHGEGTVDVFGYGINGVFGAVQIIDQGESRSVRYRANRAFQNRWEQAVQACV